MKRIVLAVFALAILGIYLIFQKNNPSLSTSAITTTENGKYKDGTYTGSSEDAFYGNIQVQVTTASGKITDVQFLQYPNDRHDSIEINQNAMPILRQEAITNQSVQVDTVTGATDTSEAFVKSLQTALGQA